MTTTASSGPLDGVRVLDLTRVVAGPYCTMLLGDLGADVVKVERPGTGDDTRGWGPPFVDGESTYFLAVNRNKRSLTLDLATDEGRDLARRLARTADIVVESFRPGTAARLGLDYASLAADHPRLVYGSVSGFGSTGPYRDRAGYDVMVAALGGLVDITGHPDGPPAKVGVALVDVCTGLYLHGALIAALRHAERTGRGQHVESSLLATTLGVLINAGSQWLIGGQRPQRMGTGHTSIVPYQAFPTADGWVMIGAGNDGLFARLAEALGQPGWADDPRFATNAERVAHRDDLVAAIAEVTRRQPTAHWLDRLTAVGVAVAPINSVPEAFDDPQVRASGQVVEVDHANLGPIRLVGPAVDLAATPASVRRPPPVLGQHSEQVLADDLGLDPATIAGLRDRGVV